MLAAGPAGTLGTISGGTSQAAACTGACTPTAAGFVCPPGLSTTRPLGVPCTSASGVCVPSRRAVPLAVQIRTFVNVERMTRTVCACSCQVRRGSSAQAAAAWLCVRCARLADTASADRRRTHAMASVVQVGTAPRDRPPAPAAPWEPLATLQVSPTLGARGSAVRRQGPRALGTASRLEVAHPVPLVSSRR